MIYLYKNSRLQALRNEELEILAKNFIFDFKIYIGKNHKDNKLANYLEKIEKISNSLLLENKNELIAILYLKLSMEKILSDLNKYSVEEIAKRANILISNVYVIKYIKKTTIFYYLFHKFINVKKNIITYDSNTIKKHLFLYNENRSENARKLFCHAPFTQMYFSFEGDVIVCCQNREYSIGNLYEKNINDIWYGESLNKFRENIKNNNLEYGCQECKQALLQGNYSVVPASFFYDNYASYSHETFPSVLEFEISNRCNLSCIMCNEKFSSSILNNKSINTPSPYTQNFINNLRTIIPHLKNVVFKGGEPFVIQEYYEIWDLIAEINPSLSVTIITNATFLNDRVKALLNKINFKLVLSIDSMKKEQYEKIRIGASFEKTMQNLDYFIKISRTEKGQLPKLTINVCVMQNNWQEIPDFLKFCNDNNITLLFIMIQAPYYLSLSSLGPINLLLILKKLSAIELSCSNMCDSYNGQVYKNMLTQIEQWQKEATERDDIRKVENTMNIINDYYLNNKDRNKENKLQINYITFFNELLNKSKGNNPDFIKIIAEFPTEILIECFESNASNEVILKEIYNHYDTLKRDLIAFEKI